MSESRAMEALVQRDRRLRPREVYSPGGQTPWETFAVASGFRVRDVLTLKQGKEGSAGEQACGRVRARSWGDAELGCAARRRLMLGPGVRRR